MKKQNKKKSFSEVIINDWFKDKTEAQVMISLFVIFLVLIGIAFYTGEYKPHPKYNITKTECWNETHNPDTKLETISGEIIVNDFRSNSEKFVDSFIPLFTDKIEVNNIAKICGSYVQGYSNSLTDKVSITIYPEYYYNNKEIIDSDYVRICLKTNFQVQSICLDDMCKDILFNETECNNAIRIINDSMQINLGYKKETCFRYKYKEQHCESKEVDARFSGGNSNALVIIKSEFGQEVGIPCSRYEPNENDYTKGIYYCGTYQVEVLK